MCVFRRLITSDEPVNPPTKTTRRFGELALFSASLDMNKRKWVRQRCALTHAPKTSFPLRHRTFSLFARSASCASRTLFASASSFAFFSSATLRSAACVWSASFSFSRARFVSCSARSASNPSFSNAAIAARSSSSRSSSSSSSSLGGTS